MGSWSFSVRRAAITVGLLSANLFFLALDSDRAALSAWIDRALSPWADPYRFGPDCVFLVDRGAVVVAILTVLSLVAFGVRLLFRARLRATGVDPLAPARRWVAERRWAVRAIGGASALLASNPRLLAFGIRLLSEEPARRGVDCLTVLVFGVVVPTVGVAAALRVFLHAVLSPLVDPAELERADAEGFLFFAVAVTPEAVAAVGAFTLASFGVLVALACTHASGGTYGLPIATAYTALVLGGAFSFQRASRIAVGLDGVRIGGTSRERFHAYADLDAVQVNPSGDILLRRHGKLRLRLQLHGEDAARREPIVARLREAIARAHAPGGTARRLAESGSPALFAQAARGDGDYRSLAATRDALWEIVEAPSASGDARARAARALAGAADDSERARLRAAAQRSADPRTRQTLEEIVDDGDSRRRAPS